VLAVVEHQEQVLVVQIGDEARHGAAGPDRDPEQRHERRGRRVRIGERAEVEEEHGSRKGLGRVVRDRDGDRGLAHAAWAHDRHEARGKELGRQQPDVILTSHHARHARWEEVRPGGAGGAPGTLAVAARGRRSRCRRDEAVASAGQGGDVAGAADAIAERLRRRAI
jgi:hypothetical protein